MVTCVSYDPLLTMLALRLGWVGLGVCQGTMATTVLQSTLSCGGEDGEDPLCCSRLSRTSCFFYDLVGWDEGECAVPLGTLVREVV